MIGKKHNCLCHLYCVVHIGWLIEMPRLSEIGLFQVMNISNKPGGMTAIIINYRLLAIARLVFHMV